MVLLQTRPRDEGYTFLLAVLAGVHWFRYAAVQTALLALHFVLIMR